jgi:beta-mannosidase
VQRRLRIGGQQGLPLDEEWEIAAAPAGSVADPQGLAQLTSWITGRRGTAAAMLRAAKAFDLDGPPRRFDAEDWWYRLRFAAAPAAAGERVVLVLEGLATLAQVWLNGSLLLTSENMFVAHELDVGAKLVGDNELVLRFSALDAGLAARRPRPRWRAPMVEHQQLRWFRTTLLGRTPGWSPPAAAVGPWRPIRLERRSGGDGDGEVLALAARLEGDGEGAEAVGLLELEVALASLDGDVTAVELQLSGQGGQWHTPARHEDARWRAELRAPGVAPWWPATHGAQPLYEVSLRITRRGHAEADVALGRVGFRSLHLEGPPARPDAFRLHVNGVPIFCRGACWTPLDVVSLEASEGELRAALLAVRAAGMNMLRVVGSMTYESDTFYDLCDELGILLWHDFMFANMDYPEEPGFRASVTAEVQQVLARWQGRPALALLCGDSEGEQQAAMWGAPRTSWARPLFRELLPGICAQHLPGVPYWPSSASGGAFPHQPDVGTTSYYGVGAYLRPLEDARRSNLRFASECLAFANIPEEANLRLVPGHGGGAFETSPAWKARSPRDLGASWDFDEVRDFYTRLLFGIDPTALRWSENERFLALGRVTSGHVMERAFAEWRRGGSSCGGALVFLLRDLWAGAGWGVLDSTGAPKAAFRSLARILQPLALAFTDEGLSGLALHAFNDGPAPFSGELVVDLFRHGEVRVGGARTAFALAARATQALPVVQLLDGFWDLSHAFKFGPPQADLVCARLLDAGGQTCAEAFHFPLGLSAAREREVGLAAEVAPVQGGYDVTVTTRKLALAVNFETGPHQPSDAYFHLAPGSSRTVRLTGPAGPLRGSVTALNSHATVELFTG